MKIAIVSDTHSHAKAVTAALEKIGDVGVDEIIHCGDITDAPTVALFPRGTHFVWGNCDHDKPALRRAMQRTGAICHEYVGTLVTPTHRIAFVHGDDTELLDDLIHSGAYDIICHGHTHRAADSRRESTRIVNPGALYRADPKTFAILDLASDKLTFIEIEQ